MIGRRSLWMACAAAVAGAMLAAPSALADANIQAAPPNQFVNPDVTIDQGAKVTFTNNDTVGHDVTARDAGPDGKPLFASPLTSTGQTTTVKGTEYLTTGDYAFICTIHPNMTGTIHVTSAGTPVPRPPSGGSGSGGSNSGAGGSGSDTAKPAVKLRLLDTRLSAVRRRGALRARITLSEPATVKITARSAGKIVATATAKVTRPGSRSVTLKLTRAGRKAVRRRSLAVTLSARASDAAGNAGTGRAKRTLRR